MINLVIFPTVFKPWGLASKRREEREGGRKEEGGGERDREREREIIQVGDCYIYKVCDSIQVSSFLTLNPAVWNSELSNSVTPRNCCQIKRDREW
jgi:hypothetical protein